MDDIWRRLTEDERSWIEEDGYTSVDVDEYTAEETVNRLWAEYASRGYKLADAQEMARRVMKG